MSSESQEFAIPENYRVEPELAPPVPRPVPDALSQHPHRQRRLGRSRSGALLLLALSACGLYFQDSRFMEALGLYFTPFSNFWWIGWILMAVGLWGMFDYPYPGKADPFLFLKQGLWVPARVTDLRKEVAVRVNGSDSAWAYDMYVECRHPDTEEPMNLCCRSPQFHNKNSGIDCRVGDYVTLVYLPGKFESTATPYGFTGINPDRAMVKAPAGGGGLLELLLFLGAIFYVLWGFWRYGPADFGVGDSGLWIMGSVGALAGAWLGKQAAVKKRAAEKEQLRQALEQGQAIEGTTMSRSGLVGMAILYAFASFLLTTSTLVWANGLLDRSTPIVQPVEVVDVWCTTHQALVKTYELEFVDPQTRQKTKMGINPLDLQHASGAALATYEGALGWKWQKIIFQQ